MQRSKKVVFACHCLLNQNARAQGVAKCKGVVKEFVDFCIENEYGIVPIDCPQLRYESLIRKAATKEHYDNKKTRTISRKIAAEVSRQIKFYLKFGYQVCGIFGVEGSPTCGAVRTHILSKQGRSVSVKESGIFIEELRSVLKEADLSIKILDWDIQAKKPLED